MRAAGKEPVLLVGHSLLLGDYPSRPPQTNSGSRQSQLITELMGTGFAPLAMSFLILPDSERNQIEIRPVSHDL